jgi:hypothetical protein
MKNERERPENERGGPGSQGERLKNGWEVVGEERAETENEGDGAERAHRRAVFQSPGRRTTKTDAAVCPRTSLLAGTTLPHRRRPASVVSERSSLGPGASLPPSSKDLHGRGAQSPPLSRGDDAARTLTRSREITGRAAATSRRAGGRADFRCRASSLRRAPP